MIALIISCDFCSVSGILTFHKNHAYIKKA